MKVMDLTQQVAICGDIVSNLVMATQQLQSGEEAKIVIEKEHLNNMDIYKELLSRVGVEVLEAKEEDGKAYIIVKKVQ